MHEETTLDTQDNFKVAPIISDTKWQQFKYKLISTLTGLATIGHYHTEQLTQEQIWNVKIIGGIMYVLVPLLIIILSSVITKWQLHALVVLIPGIIAPILALLADIFLSKQKKIHKYIITAIYSYLWSAHFFIARQLVLLNYISSNTYAAILILSIISVLSSATTISFAPVRQFSASTFHYEQFSFHSTLYMRFYLPFPILLTEIAMFYTPALQFYFQFLPYLCFVASLVFITWFMGWISALYNTVMFIVNNLLNCLIFGQQLTHSGHNYRGNRIWWVRILALALNIASIGLNVAFVISQLNQGKQKGEVLQSQHYFLVTFANITSFIIAGTVYLNYRLNNDNKHLLRLGQYNLTQVFDKDENNRPRTILYKIKYFFGHRQVLSLGLFFVIPISICLVATYALSHFVSAYGDGKKYNQPVTFLPEKLTTIVFLSINTCAYLFLSIIKEITRTRSKLGCSINPFCCNQYHVEVQRDMFMKGCLKSTGSFAIMALVLRIQNIQVFSNYILMLTPLSPTPNPNLYTFIYYILIPILIYRSYKRCQTFSHWFHITIIISLILTIIDSDYYYYESIFVVLAMPNFPYNPFKLLFASPFTIPKKLIHKNQCLYRIGYMLVNIFTLFIYIGTCGTLQFTMIFGLPMYWCVIPTINCQNSKTTSKKYNPSLEMDGKNSFSEWQNSNIGFLSENRSTPEHNLYQKIVSQIPFYVFRNKNPGYYLLRISKYILLVQVINDFYGLFEMVSLVGLQTQQVTTCHAKEGETIDRIVEKTWSNSPANRQCCAFSDAMKTVISGQACIKQVRITAENDIQLTGIVESNQFYELFKKCLIKSLIFNYDKLLRRTPNIELTQQQQKQAQELLDDLYGRTNKQKIDQYFPYQFMNGGYFAFEVKFKQITQSNLMKRKLPPLNKKDDNNKPKKEAIIDDFADLIGGGSTTTKLQLNSMQQKQVSKKDIDNEGDETFIKENNIIPSSKGSNQTSKIEISQLNMAVIVSAYLAILGKTNYLNPQRIHKILKKDSSTLNNFQFQGGLDLAADSVGCALKIAIGKQLQAQEDSVYEDFLGYDQNQYLGVMQSSGFSQAISKNKQDIWTLTYNQMKKTLTIKRLAKNATSLYMLDFQSNAVEAVWNNLRFELLFATNDNDQRYSIQTHQYLLRNLLVEGCEEPYGYAGYYSEQFLNL